jgi:hypothetical protein
LSGLFGLQANATACHLDFTPHVPADWNSFSISNVHLGAQILNLSYQRTQDGIRLDVDPTQSGVKGCALEFSPALSLRAKVTHVLLDGRPLLFHVEANSSDQHVTVNIPINGKRSTIDIQLKDDFEISESSTLPPLGEISRGLRVVSESWSPKRDSLTLQVSSSTAGSYELTAWNPGQIASVEGAELEGRTNTEAKVRVELPASSGGTDSNATVVFHFVNR